MTGERGHGQLLAVKRDLLAEAAAHIGRDHRHLRFRTGAGARPAACARDAAPDCRHGRSDARARRPRSATQPRVSIGTWVCRCCENAPRSRDRFGAPRHAGLDLALEAVDARPGCSASALVDQRGARRQGLGACGHGGQRLIVDHDAFGGVLGKIAVARNDAERPGRPGSAPCRSAACSFSVGCSPSIGGARRSASVHGVKVGPAEDCRRRPASRGPRRCRFPRMRAWACGERTKQACSSAGNGDVVEIAAAARVSRRRVLLARQGSADLGEIVARSCRLRPASAPRPSALPRRCSGSRCSGKDCPTAPRGFPPRSGSGSAQVGLEGHHDARRAEAALQGVLLMHAPAAARCSVPRPARPPRWW